MSNNIKDANLKFIALRCHSAHISSSCLSFFLIFESWFPLFVREFDCFIFILWSFIMAWIMVAFLSLQLSSFASVLFGCRFSDSNIQAPAKKHRVIHPYSHPQIVMRLHMRIRTNTLMQMHAHKHPFKTSSHTRSCPFDSFPCSFPSHLLLSRPERSFAIRRLSLWWWCCGIS